MVWGIDVCLSGGRRTAGAGLADAFVVFVGVHEEMFFESVIVIDECVRVCGVSAVGLLESGGVHGGRQ